MSLFWKTGRPFLFMFDPEKAHSMAVAALKTGLTSDNQIKDECLEINIAGLSFPNPLGMAPGFDKNAEVPDATLRLGFGYTEVGTITPQPQEGNPKPRLFRLSEDQAVINRMGFNNDGHEAVYQRLAAREHGGIVGVNIGANKDSENRIADYVKGVHRFYDVADYFAVNISSPNTPGLRDLQTRDNLHQLLDNVLEARARQVKQTSKLVPIFLKIAPDLDEAQLDGIAQELLPSGFDGLIVSNTTLSRGGLTDTKQAEESGGMSGRPLFERSTIILAKMRQRIGPTMPIIGVGGIWDAETALEKIRAGADLIQLFSSMVFEGPGIAARILNDLIGLCKRDGAKNILEYRDQTMAEWAARPIKS